MPAPQASNPSKNTTPPSPDAQRGGAQRPGLTNAPLRRELTIRVPCRIIAKVMNATREPRPAREAPRRLPMFFCAALVAVLRALPAAASDVPPIAELEKQMFDLVNKERESHQKKPYEYDEELAAVARAHSADMLENQFLGHESPRTGRVGQRLAAAKIRVMACGENIAMNRSIEEAHANLMKSPGHRLNILRDIFTHCGVGIARASNGLCYATQVFATPAPKVDFSTAVPELLDKLNKARIAKGLLPFQISPALNRIAAQHAMRVARAGKEVPADLSGQALDAGVRHRRLATAHLITWTPEDLTRAAPLLQPKTGWIGLGLAENTDHEELGIGILWAVVIFTDD